MLLYSEYNLHFQQDGTPALCLAFRESFNEESHGHGLSDYMQCNAQHLKSIELHWNAESLPDKRPQ